MMNFIKHYQNIIGIIVVLVIAFIAYSFFFTGGPTATLTSENVSGAQSQADQDLISLLTTLRSITLDDSIFSDARFKSLNDFGQQIVSEPVGRTNPFAPLGSK